MHDFRPKKEGESVIREIDKFIPEEQSHDAFYNHKDELNIFEVSLEIHGGIKT